MLRVFETDPSANPKLKTTYDDGTVGRLHSGKMMPGDKPGKLVPVSLDHWEFSTGDPEVASALSEMFNAPVIDTNSESENFLRVEDTGTDTLEVVIAGPSALTSDLKLWYSGQLTHHCDGVFFVSGDDVGHNCGCPELFSERKELAKVGRGPKPDIKLVFGLAADLELGTFAFKSGSWTMVEDLWKYEDALARISGPAVADLRLELVEYTTKKGKSVSYRKPVLERIRSLDDATAE
jgi:hypothetical protein